MQHADELKTEVGKLVDAADKEGPFFLGLSLTFVDVQLAPWMLRLSRVLKPYRGWPDPDPNSRWASWISAVEADAAVRATTSDSQLYLDSYERYAGEWIFLILDFGSGTVRSKKQSTIDSDNQRLKPGRYR